MKIKIIPFLSAGLVLIFLAGCEKIVTNVELPKAVSKLVVHSYISPTDIVSSRITTSMPITQSVDFSMDRWVKNATVRLTGPGSVSEAMSYDNFLNKYTTTDANFRPLAGQEYQISVSTPDGRQVSGSCKVPRLNTSVRIMKIASSQDGQFSYNYKVWFEFDDIPGEPYFYRIQAFAVEEYIDPNTQQATIRESEVWFNDKKNIIDTRLREGGTFVVEGQHYFYGWDGPFSFKMKGYRILFLSTDEHYYHFHRSVNQFDGDNPFAEPVMVYTNINNGLGIFAAYNVFMKEVPIQSIPGGN